MYSSLTEKIYPGPTFFCSVLTDQPPLNQPSQSNTADNPTFTLRDISITAKDIRKRLVKLKANKASGADAISVNVLRNYPNLDLPFEILFNHPYITDP